MSIAEKSNTKSVPAVSGENTKGGVGIKGVSDLFQGVFGQSIDNAGIVGESQKFHAIFGISHSSNNGGVIGINDTGGWGVIGRSPSKIGVSGESESGIGVQGTSRSFQGVLGQSTDNAGIVGESQTFHAIFGISHSSNNGGVIGINDKGGWGVIGRSDSNTGVSGESNTGIGLHGKGGKLAGFFEGDVQVTGDVKFGPNVADCAEDFDIAVAALVEPGSVMVLGNEGGLHQSQQPYDKRVAGVISGAGGYKPGIVLDKQETLGNRQPIALLGKVFCKVDAQFGAVEIGDLLTTSPTLGHAMKADDPFKAFGSVIGKALRPLNEGRGLIPILIALQ